MKVITSAVYSDVGIHGPAVKLYNLFYASAKIKIWKCLLCFY